VTVKGKGKGPSERGEDCPPISKKKTPNGRGRLLILRKPGGIAERGVTLFCRKKKDGCLGTVSDQGGGGGARRGGWFAAREKDPLITWSKEVLARRERKKRLLGRSLSCASAGKRKTSTQKKRGGRSKEREKKAGTKKKANWGDKERRKEDGFQKKKPHQRCQRKAKSETIEGNPSKRVTLTKTERNFGKGAPKRGQSKKGGRTRGEHISVIKHSREGPSLGRGKGPKPRKKKRSQGREEKFPTREQLKGRPHKPNSRDKTREGRTCRERLFPRIQHGLGNFRSKEKSWGTPKKTKNPVKLSNDERGGGKKRGGNVHL